MPRVSIPEDKRHDFITLLQMGYTEAAAIKKMGLKETPTDRLINGTNKVIEEEYKKTPGKKESYTEKQTRLKKKNRAKMNSERFIYEAKKQQMRKVLEAMKKAKDLKGKKSLSNTKEKMPPKRYKDMSPKEKEEFMKRKKAERESRTEKRSKQYGDNWHQKIKEERKAEQEKERQIREIDWSKDEDFRYCVKQFLMSHSIGKQSIITLKNMMPDMPDIFLNQFDVRNDQQTITKQTAFYHFIKEFGYEGYNTPNMKKAFYDIIDQYPNNFFKTEEELEEFEKKKKEREELKARTEQEREEVRQKYKVFKEFIKIVSNPNTLKYEPKNNKSIGYEQNKKNGWEERIAMFELDRKLTRKRNIKKLSNTHHVIQHQSQQFKQTLHQLINQGSTYRIFIKSISRHQFYQVKTPENQVLAWHQLVRSIYQKEHRKKERKVKFKA